MFTGIITHIGHVRSRIDGDGDTRFVIDAPFETSGILLGASICCSGACLTVVETDDTGFVVDVSAETLSCTTLDAWQPGTPINLERALKVGDELGGHIVSGHVDGVGQITGMVEEGDSWRIEIIAPTDLKGFIAAKGSITINGISLTVNAVNDTQFGVNIIPHTMTETTLGTAKGGDAVNLEIDMLARYVARLLATQNPTQYQEH